MAGEAGGGAAGAMRQLGRRAGNSAAPGVGSGRLKIVTLEGFGGWQGPVLGSRGNYASTRSAQRFPKATAKFLLFVKKDKSLAGTSSVTLLQRCCSSGFTFINSALLESWPHTTLPFFNVSYYFYSISNAFILLLINRENQMPDCHLAIVPTVHRESTIPFPSPSLPVP